MEKNKLFLLVTLCSLLVASFPLCAQTEEYPKIPDLVSKDATFKSYQKDVEASSKAYHSGLDWERKLRFYQYTANEKDTLLKISSRCAIRYDTLATLNGIAQTSESLEGKTLILPSMNALFIPEDPTNSIEILLAKEHSVAVLSGLYTKHSINGRNFYLIPDGKFSPTERAYFLDPGLKMPLDHHILTSSFGMRVSPISGKWKKHNGIDMAAPLGSPIYACKSAVVKSAVAMDPVYGNYIILDHSSGMTSLYAHMSEMLVKKGDSVKAGQTIGKVGTTGMSTGPHLHFEIRLNGEAQDPQKYLQNL